LKSKFGYRCVSEADVCNSTASSSGLPLVVSAADARACVPGGLIRRKPTLLAGGLDIGFATG
jgi:hypothetical protein